MRLINLNEVAGRSALVSRQLGEPDKFGELYALSEHSAAEWQAAAQAKGSAPHAWFVFC